MEVEKRLKISPDNSRDHLVLVGYYGMHYWCCIDAKKQRIPHILWLIENVPFYEGYNSYSEMDLADRDGYKSVLRALERKINANSSDTDLVFAVAHFMKSHEPEKAILLFEECARRKPEEPEYVNGVQDFRETEQMRIRHRNEFLTEPFGYTSEFCDGTANF